MAVGRDVKLARRFGAKRNRVAGLVVALLLVGAASVAVVHLRSIVASVSKEAGVGRDQLLAGAHIVKVGGGSLTVDDSAAASADFTSASVHFDRARSLLTRGLFMRALAHTPWVDSQVHAAVDLSDMGFHLSRTGELGVAALNGALPQKTRGASVAGNPGQKVLETLQALDLKLGAITAEIDLALADRKAIPRSGLLPPLSKAVIQLDQKVDIQSIRDGVKTLAAQEPAIRQMLGAAGTRTYLVLQQDPAELRATGGFIGSVGFLVFDHGKMAPFNPTDVYAIDQKSSGQLFGFPGASTGVAPPAPLAKTFQLNSWALRDSNWSPDFPTAARQAELFLRLEAGRSVDGVISIDPYFIARLLAVIGPTTVPETGDVVDTNNFFATTLTRVEVDQTGAGHKGFLSFAAKAIFARLLAVPPSKWVAMLDALGWGCGSRSLQAYFHDAPVQRLVDQHSCGGRLEPLRGGDGLMVVNSNVGGNKDDFWLERTYSLKVAFNPDGSARHTLQIHFFGLTPHAVQLTKSWGYTGWLRIYLPPSSSLVLSSGADLHEASDLGRRVLEGWVYVPFSSTLDVDVTYTVGTADMRPSNGHLEILWQKQAGRPGDPVTVEVTPPSGWHLTAAQLGKVALADPIKSDLSTDRLFVFALRRS